MIELFLKNYASDAIAMNIKFKPGVSFFETSSKTFVLVDANVSGCITEKIKTNINKRVSNSIKPIIYVSMYKNKKDFSESRTDIAEGTYVWCSDNPSHYVHFDDKPSKLIIHKTPKL